MFGFECFFDYRQGKLDGKIIKYIICTVTKDLFEFIRTHNHQTIYYQDYRLNSYYSSCDNNEPTIGVSKDNKSLKVHIGDTLGFSDTGKIFFERSILK